MKLMKLLAVVPVLLLCNAMEITPSPEQSAPPPPPTEVNSREKVFSAGLLRNIATYLEKYAGPSDHCSLLTPYQRCSQADKNQLALKVVTKQINNELGRIDGVDPTAPNYHEAVTVLFDRHIKRYVVNNLVKSVLVKYDLWENPQWFNHMYGGTPVPVAFVAYMDAAGAQPLDIRTIGLNGKSPSLLGTIAAEMVGRWADLGMLNQPLPIQRFGTADTVDDPAEPTVMGSLIRKRGTDRRQHEYSQRNEDDRHGIFDLGIQRQPLQLVQQEVQAGRYPPFFKIVEATEQMMQVLSVEPKGDSDDTMFERSERFYKMHGPQNNVDPIDDDDTLGLETLNL